MVSEKHYTKKLKTILHSNVFYGIWILFIILFVIFHLQDPFQTMKEEKIQFEGKIVEYKWNDEKETIELTLKNKKKKELVFYTYQKEEKENLKKEIQYGKQVKGVGNKTAPTKNTIPNTFDYQKYLKSLGYDYYIKSNEINLFEKGTFHDKIHEYLRRCLNEKKESNYYKAFLLGIKENWDSNLDQIYRENGLSHIFVISGMHLGFLFYLFQKIIKKISKKKKIQFFLSFLCLSLYYSFLTKSVSSDRAYGFLFMITLNEILNLKLNSKQIYLLNIGLQLLKNPFLPFHVGFQYSVALSFSFCFFSIQDKSQWKKILKNSIMAFFVSFPITLNQTFTINPWSILLNIFMIPLLSSFLIPLFIFSLFIPYLEYGVAFFLEGMEWCNNLFYHLPFSHISMPKMPYFLFFGYYICTFTAIYFKKRKIFFFWCIFWFFFLFIPKLDSSGYFYFLDVGQGDCTLIISPYQREIILIDTGNKSEYLKNNILLFLKSLGIQKIDYLILSHGDFDHTGNALEILKEIKVKKIVLNQGEKNEVEQEIEKKYQSRFVHEIKTNALKTTILSHKIQKNENDNSTILHVCIYKSCTLFLGDASTMVEEEIMSRYHIKSLILKVAHHGSKTSTSEILLEHIPFQYGVISVGKNNPYLMPHQTVTERLKKHHINQLETKTLGTICFKIKKKRYTIFSFPP